MKRYIRLGFLTLFMIVAVRSADAGCIDMGSARRWSRVDTHTIILYQSGGDALAVVKLPYCYVYPSSRISKLKDYVCTWDKILVDEEVCDVRIEKL